MHILSYERHRSNYAQHIQKIDALYCDLSNDRKTRVSDSNYVQSIILLQRRNTRCDGEMKENGC